MVPDFCRTHSDHHQLMEGFFSEALYMFSRDSSESNELQVNYANIKSL